MRRSNSSASMERRSGRPLSRRRLRASSSPHDAGTASVSAPPSPSLDRRLGPFDAAAIVVSNVIGGGIFFSPIIVAGLVPSARGILLVWFIGGALPFARAPAVAGRSGVGPPAGGGDVFPRGGVGAPERGL